MPSPTSTAHTPVLATAEEPRRRATTLEEASKAPGMTFRTGAALPPAGPTPWPPTKHPPPPARHAQIQARSAAKPHPAATDGLDVRGKPANPPPMLYLPSVAACCALAAVSALLVVLMRRPVHVAVALLGHSLAMAALYLNLSSQLLAAAQVMIYTGAIVVLFLIVVALLPEGGKEKFMPSHLVAAVLAFGGVFAVFAAALWAFEGGGGALPKVLGPGDSVAEIGRPLFQSLLVPFELTAPLLLAAIVTAIALWRRQEPPERAAKKGALS
jgi:NADH-quinone oxidoreductase subunit J